MSTRVWTRRLAFLASVTVAASAAAQSEPELVTVLQRLPANYRDAVALLSTLDRASPAQTTVAPKEGMSNVISRLYSVGLSNAPAAYAQIRDSIQTLNSLADRDALKAGQTLLVPDIPRMALANPNLANPYNAVSKLSFDVRRFRQSEGPINTKAQKIEDKLRVGAQAVLQVRRLKPEDAKAALARDPDALIGHARLHLKFLDVKGLGGASPVLSPQQAALIATSASGAAPQKPILFIFDDTWPSLQDEEASRTYLLQAVATLREHANFPPMVPFERACALGMKVGALPPVAAVPHAAQIEQALKPMTDAAGPRSPVTVVYIPNLGGRPCAGEVIGQIIEWHLLAYQVQGVVGVPVPASDVQAFHAQAQIDINALQSADALAQADSDVEAIQAVLEFTRRHGALSGQPVFTSMSWEFEGNQLDPKVPSEYGGLFIVAAGNDGQSPPVIQTKRQFSERSFHPGDMLAVMNVDDQGVFLCDSSLVDPSGNAFAVGFRGDLSRQDCGGTSFSAPRVAWLLALREARRAPVGDMTDLSNATRAEFKSGGYFSINADRAKPLTIDRLIRTTP
jgi:hypothetical protein